MRKLLSILGLSLFLVTPFLTINPVMAGYVTTDGLSDEQKAQLELQAAQMKKANDAPPTITADKMKEYAEVGQAVGHALVATAKELGVEVNVFADTKVGKYAMFLLAWKLIGAQLVHVFVGLLLLMVLNPIWVWAYRRFCVLESVTKESNGFLKGSKKHVEYRRASGDQMWGMWIALAIIWAVAIIIIF